MGLVELHAVQLADLDVLHNVKAVLVAAVLVVAPVVGLTVLVAVDPGVLVDVDLGVLVDVAQVALMVVDLDVL